MARVLIEPAGYETCRQAVERAFELFPLDVRGKTVLVKPNVLRAAQPQEGIVTHPAILAAVVEHLEGMGPARIVVGDNPGIFTYGANERAFRDSGLMEAARGHYVNLGIESKEVDFNPAFKDKVSPSKEILEADVFISLPKFKTHGLSVVTGAIKNSFGILPGAQKANLHRLAGDPIRFQEMLVDVFRLRAPDLFIVDAVLGMEGNGPACTDLREIGLVLAGDNAVALDATIARLMGLEPGRLHFLQKAKEAGLGDYAAESIEIIGRLEPIPDFKLPPMGEQSSKRRAEVQEYIHSRTLLRPSADPEACTGCGTCVDNCPVSALSMPAELPIVDPDKCIVCFCCQEMCPEKAIQLGPQTS